MGKGKTALSKLLRGIQGRPPDDNKSTTQFWKLPWETLCHVFHLV